MKIGIPRAMLWHKYYCFWKVFFEKLDLEVIESSETNKEIVKAGANVAVDELCIPIKIFYGHCASLINQCDLIFIPRYVRIEKNAVTCPKIITLPDTATMALKRTQTAAAANAKILTVTINRKLRPLWWSWFLLGLKLRKNPFKVIAAYRAANKAQRAHEAELEATFQKRLANDKIKIAVMGHEYNIHNDYLSAGLIAELEHNNVTIITPELVPKALIDKHLRQKPYIYWSFEKEIVGAAYWALTAQEIEGLVLVSSFNCGPDSFLHEQIVIENKSKPVISIYLDESTSKEVIKTRIGAFIEMVKRNKEKQKKQKKSS